MKEISLEELKKIELDILTYIDQVCKENNLRYFLCGGTLLGAIRHQGFIPWDDDIDICMPRLDYERFIEIVKEADSKYKIFSPGQEGYYYNFSKVIDSETELNEYYYKPIENLGVYVDVFPVEGMPSDEAVRKQHFDKLYALRKRINSFSLVRPRIRKNLVKYVQSLILYAKNKKSSLSKFQREYKELANLYNYDEAEYVYMSGGAYAKKEMFPKAFIDNYETRVFEKREFNTIKDYDAYLTQLYGNYMQLPPKEKQITHHAFVARYKKKEKIEE